MSLHHLTSLIHTKTSTLTFPSKPSATIPPSPTFRRLQSFFTVRMIEDCGCISGLVFLWPWIVGRLLHSPNIVGDFGYGWVFWQHGRKLIKACARMLLMYWKISPTAFPRLLSVFWQGGIRNHEVPGYAHQSYPLSPHSRFPSRFSGILLLSSYHQSYQPFTLDEHIRVGHNTSINLFPCDWLLIPTLIQTFLVNQSGNYVSLHAVVG